jgi:putative hydrolase of the HAD superfamily
VLPDRRAVLFDLDDTLYPYRRFVTSGFAAVARRLDRAGLMPWARAFRLLVRASRGSSRGRELQRCLDVCQASPALFPELLRVLRDHHPALKLPPASAALLRRLRAEGWRLGIVTNGSKPIQARKIAALELRSLVDTVVYATEHGSGAGKPEPEPFRAALGRLGVPAPHAIFVGNDDVCDVQGAAAAGLLTIHCAVWTPRQVSGSARAEADRLRDIADLARALLQEESARHAA